jgi:hypothetical protein
MRLGRIVDFCILLLLNAATSQAAVTVTVHPVRAPLTLTQPQQFTATVAGTKNQSVTWAVDGVAGGNSSVGTITSGGLYTPPAAPGVHHITAKSVAQSSAVGAATVWATNYPGMFTHHADQFRSGVNFQELALSPATVNHNTFGKIFARAVDGQIYAQPLIVTNLTIAGAKHNVVYVATEHGSVFAFDADGKITAPFWQRSFINPSAGVTTIPEPSSGLIEPEISITGTPVIEGSTGTIYVAVSTEEHHSIVHRLHALSITTGTEKFGGPIVIQGSVPGTYPPLAVNGRLSFAAQHQFQRASLLLLNGVVYIAFASFGDALPYNGWLFAYTAQGTGSLHQAGIFCTSPDKGASAIWQSGGGPTADNQGNVYVATGNGPFNLNTGGRDAGDSVLKLALQSSGLVLLDFFTPADQDQLRSSDTDLGASGPMLPPFQSGAADPNLLVEGGKDGNLYLVNRDNMGKFNASHNSNVETVPVGHAFPVNGLFSTPAEQGTAIYIGEIGEPLKLFTFSRGLLSSAPTAETANSFGFPGTTPMISANGSAGGIVWALDLTHYLGNNHPNPGPAVLHAYNAGNLAEIYNSTQAGARDQAGVALKFTAPTIANGRVYVGTAGQLDVYGFLP